MIKQADLFSFSNYRIQTEKSHWFKKIKRILSQAEKASKSLPFLDGNISCQQTKTQFKIQ